MNIAMLGMAIPILAILGCIVGPLLLVWLVLHQQQLRTARIHQTVLELATKGLPVPAALLDPPRARRSAFMTPLTLIGLGVGLSASFALIGDAALRFGAPLGVLPIAIGVAQLIALRLDRSSAAGNDGSQPPA